jgi:hypothetical protein
MLQSFAAWSFRGIAGPGFFGFFGEASHRLLMGACDRRITGCQESSQRNFRALGLQTSAVLPAAVNVPEVTPMLRLRPPGISATSDAQRIVNPIKPA